MYLNILCFFLGKLIFDNLIPRYGISSTICPKMGEIEKTQDISVSFFAGMQHHKMRAY